MVWKEGGMKRQHQAETSTEKPFSVLPCQKFIHVKLKYKFLVCIRRKPFTMSIKDFVAVNIENNLIQGIKTSTIKEHHVLLSYCYVCAGSTKQSTVQRQEFSRISSFHEGQKQLQGHLGYLPLLISNEQLSSK